MKRAFFTFATLLALSTGIAHPVVAQVTAVPSAMNFQGRLARPDGTPVPDGTYSIRFSLWTAASAGTENWNQTINPVTVRNGAFAVQLSAFPANTFNSNQWLEIKIGTNPALTPRQQLVTVPYAFKADLALTVPDASITNIKIAPGTLTADRFAPNIFNPLAWLLVGNSGTNPTTHFLGTTDNNPLTFKVNSRRAMQYSYAENTTSAGLEYRSINVLGGSEINSIGAGVVGATLAGGGWDFFTGTDYPNIVTADFGTVSGGFSNTVSVFAGTIGGGFGNNASNYYATVAGGQENTASGFNATVGGGDLNTASGDQATVGGGGGNTATALSATVGGGNGNHATATEATIAGGSSNNARAIRATVGGGNNNFVRGNGATISGGVGNNANGTYTTVAGGQNNFADNIYATVVGGQNNTASGEYSFAAGRQATANHKGAFVWADNTNAVFNSSADGEFSIRASGGTRIFSNSTTTTGVVLAPGGGSWSSASDRNLKTHFQSVDPMSVLDSLCTMPVTTWNYKANLTIRHIGVMAQDFYAAFGGLGVDDKHIDTVDADGVAFAAIQGLNRKLEARERRLNTLEAQNEVLRKRQTKIEADNTELKAELEALKAAVRQLQNDRK